MPGQMFNLNGFEKDVGVLIWHLGPNNSEKKDIVIGPYKSLNENGGSTYISREMLKEMYMKGPTHYMTIVMDEIKNDDTYDALTIKDTDALTMEEEDTDALTMKEEDTYALSPLGTEDIFPECMYNDIMNALYCRNSDPSKL